MTCLFVRLPRRTLVRKNRRINSYTAFQFREKFKFAQGNARDIMKCWKIFDAPTYRLDNSAHVFHPEEAFLIFLSRQTDLKKLSAMEDEFGIDYTTLSRCVFSCVYSPSSLISSFQLRFAFFTFSFSFSLSL